MRIALLVAIGSFGYRKRNAYHDTPFPEVPYFLHLAQLWMPLGPYLGHFGSHLKQTDKVNRRLAGHTQKHSARPTPKEALKDPKMGAKTVPIWFNMAPGTSQMVPKTVT